MDTNVSSGLGNGKHRNKEILQYLIPKVVHGLADPLAVGGLVARKARAALAVGNAREDALGQGERVGIVAFHAGAVYESGKGVSGRRVGATLIVALLGRHLVQGALKQVRQGDIGGGRERWHDGQAGNSSDESLHVDVNVMLGEVLSK